MFLYLAAGIIAIGLFVLFRRDGRQIAGPRNIPIFGSIPFINLKTLHKDLAEQYKDQPIVRIILGGQEILVLNTYEAVDDALVKHGRFFIDRSPADFIVNRITKNENLGMIHLNGAKFLNNRSFCRRGFAEIGFGKASFDADINHELTNLIDHLAVNHLDEAFYLFEHIQKSSSNMICLILFGQRYPYDDEQLDDLLNSVENGFVRRMVGAALVRMFPWLKLFYYLPGDVLGLHHMEKAMDKILTFAESKVTESMERKDPNNVTILGFVDYYLHYSLEKVNDGSAELADHFSRTQLNHLVREMFIVGSNSIASVLDWIVLALVVHTDVQEKCRQEILEKLGRQTADIQLTYNDRTLTPYVEATIAEILRYAVGSPLTLPQLCRQSCPIQGVDVVEGDLIVVNRYALMRDERHFAHADQFSPERFLNEDGSFKKIDQFLPFLTGKRSCIGEPLAKRVLYLTVVRLLQRFRLRPFADDLPLSWTPRMGVNFRPELFRVLFSEL